MRHALKVAIPLALFSLAAWADTPCTEEVSSAELLFNDLVADTEVGRQDWIATTDVETLENQLIEGLRRAAANGAGAELDAFSLQLIEALGRTGDSHIAGFLQSLLGPRSTFGPLTRARLRGAVSAIAARPVPAPSEPTTYDDDYPFVVGEPSDDDWHAMDLADESMASPEALAAAFDAFDEHSRPEKRIAAKWIFLTTRVVPYVPDYDEEARVQMVAQFLDRGDLDTALFVWNVVRCDLDSLPQGDLVRIVDRVRARWDRTVTARDILAQLRGRLGRGEAQLVMAELALLASRPSLTARAVLARGDWTVTDRALAALRSRDTSDEHADALDDLVRALRTAQESMEP